MHSVRILTPLLLHLNFQFVNASFLCSLTNCVKQVGKTSKYLQHKLLSKPVQLFSSYEMIQRKNPLQLSRKSACIMDKYIRHKMSFIILQNICSKMFPSDKYGIKVVTVQMRAETQL